MQHGSWFRMSPTFLDYSLSPTFFYGYSWIQSNLCTWFMLAHMNPLNNIVYVFLRPDYKVMNAYSIENQPKERSAYHIMVNASIYNIMKK